MRYTEARLAAAAQDLLLEDLEAGTVDWAKTFDASQVRGTQEQGRGNSAEITLRGPSHGPTLALNRIPCTDLSLSLGEGNRGSAATARGLGAGGMMMRPPGGQGSWYHNCWYKSIVLQATHSGLNRTLSIWLPPAGHGHLDDDLIGGIYKLVL
jgi:hypothetical protein